MSQLLVGGEQQLGSSKEKGEAHFSGGRGVMM